MKERKAIEGRFAGKVAAVTGGSAGIGRAVVEQLCAEGAAVAFSGIESELSWSIRPCASFISATDLRIDGGYLGMGPEGLGKDAVCAGSE